MTPKLTPLPPCTAVPAGLFTTSSASSSNTTGSSSGGAVFVERWASRIGGTRTRSPGCKRYVASTRRLLTLT